MFNLYGNLCLILLCAIVFQFESVSTDKCESKKKCHECIQSISGCQWCPDEYYNVSTSRCVPINSIGCKSVVQNPESTNEPTILTPSKTSKFEPSNVGIKLRVGDKVNISFAYTDEKNRPLDLYILMDLSCTMSKYKTKVASLALVVVNDLKHLTDNLVVGFGSFVDKPITPYAQMKTTKDETCNDIPVKPTYSFKNELPLTTNVDLFQKTVEDSIASSNVDAPEGGLDALMQAVVCSNQIGWRNNKLIQSRRIILFATDGPFHIAGDGKLAGILAPNDGLCHMDKDYYDPKIATTTDYPSISQIRQKLEQNDIYVIFVVPNILLPLYKNLSEVLSPLSVARLIDKPGDQKARDLSETSSIADIIREEYEKLVGTVQIQVQNPSPSLGVTFYRKCSQDGQYEKNNSCSNMKPGSTVHYKVEVELKSCPVNKIVSQTVKINPSFGSHHEPMEIEVDMFCGCECEQQNSTKPSEACHSNGHLQCGICQCDQDWGGRYCNCSSSSLEGQNFDQSTCGHDCNGRGDCVCGACKCFKNGTTSYSGDYCECDELSCKRTSSDEGVCNSKLGQGKCCGKCFCNPGFQGVRCQCPDKKKLQQHSDCMDNVNNEAGARVACNGNGECICNKDSWESPPEITCLCNQGYSETFCHIQHAQAKSCQQTLKLWESCIKCVTLENNTVSYCRNKGKCEPMILQREDKITKSNPDLFTEQEDCFGSIKDNEDCELNFIIKSKDIRTKKTDVVAELTVNKESNCPAHASPIVVILSVVGSVLLIGIFTLLIWKILTHIHDKKEFEKFENERNAASWGEEDNPLYRSNVTEFQNPVHAREH